MRYRAATLWYASDILLSQQIDVSQIDYHISLQLLREVQNGPRETKDLARVRVFVMNEHTVSDLPPTD